METVITSLILVALVVGRLYAAKVANDFIETLPDAERAHIKRCLARNAY